MFMSNRYYDILHTRRHLPTRQNLPHRNNEDVVVLFVVQNRSVVCSIEIDNRIDEESKVILHTFNEEIQKVYSTYMTTNVPSLRLEKSTPSIDFSSLIIHLSKIMERELNNSVVQYIRMLNGVEMPRYYREHKPNTPVVITIGREECDINALRDGVWRSQTMGTIKYLIEEYKDSLEGIFDSPVNEFISLWEKLRNKRNGSSHTEITDESDFVTFYQYFCKIVVDGWLSKLMDLKEELMTEI